jgi:hypothetical protein
MLSVGTHRTTVSAFQFGRSHHSLRMMGDPTDWKSTSIVMAVAAHIDLNTLDNLARTCRAVRQDLLQYRKMLLVSTQHCCNEDLPVDKDEILRYRARAANWFYMQDLSNTSSGYRGKAGQCARDLVSECRRCGTVVCRVSWFLCCCGMVGEAITET